MVMYAEMTKERARLLCIPVKSRNDLSLEDSKFTSVGFPVSAEMIFRPCQAIDVLENAEETHYFHTRYKSL